MDEEVETLKQCPHCGHPMTRFEETWLCVWCGHQEDEDDGEFRTVC